MYIFIFRFLDETFDPSTFSNPKFPLLTCCILGDIFVLTSLSFFIIDHRYWNCDTLLVEIQSSQHDEFDDYGELTLNWSTIKLLHQEKKKRMI